MNTFPFVFNQLGLQMDFSEKETSYMFNVVFVEWTGFIVCLHW